MTLRWNIDSQLRRITATAEGDVQREEFERFSDAIADAGALEYPKLFDGSAAHTSMRQAELLTIGVKIKSFHDRPVGPLAIVLPEDTTCQVGKVLGILATAKRPMRLFKSVEAAQRLLDNLEHSTQWLPPGGRRSL